MKTKETEKCEYAIFKATRASGLGIYGGFEVSVGSGYGKERVDFMTMNSKEEFRCYEIKVSKSDFKSKCALSFIGDFNFFVLPKILYDKVKLLIPENIVVYAVYENECIANNGSIIKVPTAYLVKKSSRNKEVDRKILMHAMVRSLSRLETKQFNENNTKIYKGE